MAKMEKPDVIGLEQAAGVPEDVTKAEQPIEIVPPPGTGETPDTQGIPEPIDAEQTIKTDAPPGMEAPETKPGAESRTESGGFLRNIVDRVKLWREKARVGKQEVEVKKLTAKKEAEEKKATEAKKAEEKLAEAIKKTEEDFKKALKNESAEPDLGVVSKEIEIFQKRAETALEKAKEYEGKIEGVQEKVDGYKEKVKEATERIDGRLLAKQEKNNEAINKIKIQREGLDDHVKIFDSEIDKIKDQEKQLEDGLKDQTHKKIRAVYQEKILEIQKMIRGFEKDKEEFVKKRDLAASKIKAMEGDNKDLQNKREELNPELKKKGNEAAPAEAGEAATPAEATSLETATTETAPSTTPNQSVEAPSSVSSPSEGEVGRGPDGGGTRAIELKILDLEEEKERLESMDLTEMAAKTAELTPPQKRAVQKMMKTGKYEMPKGTEASEAAGAEVNRIFQRIPQVNKELADLRRQLKRAQLGGGEVAPRARGKRRGAEAATVAPVVPEAPPPSESAKLEAASKFKVDQEVKVRRSDGSIEGKWMVTEIGNDGMVSVVKNVQEAPGRIVTYSKHISADELLEVNKPLEPEISADAPLEAPEDLPVVDEPAAEEPAPEKPAVVPPVVEVPPAPEKSSEDVKKEILKKIEEDASDKNLQETVDSSHRMFYDDDFENKEIGGIQEKIDLFKKIGKEDFFKKLEIEGVDAGRLDDTDFEELRGTLLKRFTKWKELAEKSLKENPNPRPEKKSEPPPEPEKPAEPPVEKPKPAEPVAEAPAGEGDSDVFGALADEIEKSEGQK